jgi:hypothetical protein
MCEYLCVGSIEMIMILGVSTIASPVAALHSHYYATNTAKSVQPIRCSIATMSAMGTCVLSLRLKGGSSSSQDDEGRGLRLGGAQETAVGATLEQAERVMKMAKARIGSATLLDQKRAKVSLPHSLRECLLIYI